MSRRAAPLAVRLTRRLALIAAAAFAATTAGFAVYYTADPDYLGDEALGQQMARLEAALVARPDGALVLSPAERALFERHPDAYAFALLDGDGAVLDGANLALLPAPAFQTGMFAADWVARPAGDAGIWVASHRVGEADETYLRLVFAMLGDPAGLVARALWIEFVGHVLIPLAPAGLLLLAANALAVRRGLAPLAEAAAWARGVAPGALVPPCAAETAAPEIGDLVAAARRALQRLYEALEVERRRAAEAAHALRTPLAVLTARLDALPPGPEAEHLRADMAALSRTVRQVLDAASAEALTVADGAAVDLARVAEDTVAALAPYGFEQGVELDLEVAPDAAPALGDERAIALALSNLVENAILHGAGAARVRVGPGPTVTVEDDGPGLPPGDPARLFEPFRRGAHARPGGSGLGLAIVARVQRAHGGAVEVESPETGGARFRLRYRPASATGESRQVGVRFAQ